MVVDAMDRIKKTLTIFSDRRTVLKFSLYSLAAFLVLGIPTALIPNPVFHRMIPSTPLDYVFLVTTALLGGLYLAMPWDSCAPDGKAGISTILGVFAFACPTCDMLLVFLFGSAFLLTFFDPIRPVLGVASILLMTYAINKKLKQVARPGLNGANNGDTLAKPGRVRVKITA